MMRSILRLPNLEETAAEGKLLDMLESKMRKVKAERRVVADLADLLLADITVICLTWSRFEQDLTYWQLKEEPTELSKTIKNLPARLSAEMYLHTLTPSYAADLLPVLPSPLFPDLFHYFSCSLYSFCFDRYDQMEIKNEDHCLRVR
jgi:hypothetical protein